MFLNVNFVIVFLFWLLSRPTGRRNDDNSRGRPVNRLAVHDGGSSATTGIGAEREE
jgi:hypothetical protein